jgi:hypothetical protein
LCTDAGDGRLDFSFGVQAVSLSHDLTDMLEISGHGALQGGDGFGKAGKGTHPERPDQAFVD